MTKNKNLLIKSAFIRKTQKEDSNLKHVDLGWFSISHVFIEKKNERRKFYGKWFKIKSSSGTIYRQLKFDPILVGRSENPEINIDWDGFIKLHNYDLDSDSKEVKCEIRKAKCFEILIANITHPNQGLRSAFILGLVSLLIGIISLIVSIIN